jgi:hypothetical protein
LTAWKAGASSRGVGDDQFLIRCERIEGTIMSSKFQSRMASGRALLLTSTVTIAVYLAIVLGTAPELAQRAGGLAIFDLMPMGYDESYARLLLDRLGEEGRRYYLTRQIPLDAIYPALLAIWLIALWRYLADKVGRTAGWVRQVWLVPILVAGFDYAENITVAGLILSYPDLDPNLVRIASGLTIAKSILSTVCFTALLGLGGLLAFRRLRPAS